MAVENDEFQDLTLTRNRHTMPVTEFAVYCLRSSYDELDFLETLMHCQEIQDRWTRINQPYNLEPNTSLSSYYIERSCDTLDPEQHSRLLITAPWASAEAHNDWVKTAEAQECKAKLADFLKPGTDSILAWHLDPAGKEGALRRAILEKESFHAARVIVGAGEKDALQKAYTGLDDQLHEAEGVNGATDEPARAASRQKAWAGWRIEQMDGNEELVVFWTDEVPTEKIAKVLDLGHKVVRRCFKHVV